MQPARAGRPTSAARHLGRDMECQQDRRYADEPKKLIHRKHGSPPKVPDPGPHDRRQFHRCIIMCCSRVSSWSV